MRLIRIELCGFKSFCDRVTIHFDEVITGIVGPNGCGKSNVLDAIRWVMGEQSIKNLRGRSRSDVIFNGSERRKGASSAEVTLVLADVPAEHRPEGYEDCDEIAITRRLDKRGVSSYSLNKQPARLRDIRMLFLGTGLGKNSYAIIEQGKVNEFIQSSPEKRRLWIEEAAGISRYKEQRKTAESKLSQTQDHVDRLNDILQTISSQRKSLQRQANKARKFRVLSEEIEDLDLYLCSHKYLSGWARDRQLGLLLGDLGAQESVLREDMTRHEIQIQGLEGELKEASGELHEIRTKLQDKVSRLALIQQTREHLQEDIARVEKRLKLVKKEQEEGSSQMENAAERTAALIEELKSVRSEQSEQGEELEAADLRLQELQAQLQEADREIEALKGEVIEAVRQVTSHRNQLQSAQKRHEELTQRFDASEEEARSLEEQEQELQTQYKQTERLFERCRYERDYLEGQREQLTDTLLQTRQDLTVAQQQFREIQTTLAEKQARLNSLEELQAEYGDLNDACRALLQARDKGQLSNKMAIRGALLEFLEVPQKFEGAVAAVLGEKLHHLVVRNPEVAVEAIQHLNENELGRAGFLSMNAEPLHEPISLPEHPAVVGCLADHIGTQQIFRPLIESLFGNCIVVQELEDAVYIMAEMPSAPVTWVSLTGDVIFADGQILGGRAASQELGVLQRRRQVKELTEEIERIEEEYDEREDTVTGLQDEVEALEEQQETQREELQQLNVKETALSKDIQRQEADLQRLQERASLLRREGGRLQLQRESLEKEQEQVAQQLEILVAQQEAAEAKLLETRERMTQDRTSQQELISELTELKVQIASRREREESIQHQIRSLQDRQNNIEAHRKKLEEERTQLEEELVTRKQNIEDAGAELENLNEGIAEYKDLVKAQGSQFEEEEQRLQSLRTTLERLRKKLEATREERTELLLEQREIQVNQQALDQEVRQQYGITIGEALPGQHCKPSPAPADEKRLKSLKDQRNKLGEVNPLAEEEFNQIDEKFQFMREQISDLEKTITSLHQTIKKINTKTKEQFRETFEAIRDHFSALFPKLFEGGAANLILTKPEDLLETGVDIMVRPPGKRRQNIMLLSGGEKALTTTALIFSFFLYKPSPFCILDEVDAPLDDVNIDRYNRLLRELSGVTQFLVITHNKRTMELADQLYGVTMQEPGVSTVVTVRIEDNFSTAA